MFWIGYTGTALYYLNMEGDRTDNPTRPIVFQMLKRKKKIKFMCTQQLINQVLLNCPANLSLPIEDYERYGGVYVTTNNIAKNPDYWNHCSKVVPRVFGLDYPEYVTKIQVSREYLLPDPSIVNKNAIHANVYWIPPVNDGMIIKKYFVKETDIPGIFTFTIIF